tara:strand:+ start:572 stop:1492 length:921 start_codon:yes stop_codon:yes gene_type:complete
VSYLNQKTINNPIKFGGISLHSGKKVNVCLKPSEPNSGIIFKRVDLKVNNIIHPNFINVSNTSLNTTISNDFGVKVSTIEHLMGAFFGLGIDNILVEIDNDEVPILDGSAKEFISLISESGIKSSDSPIKIIKIKEKVEFKDGQRLISIEPSKLSLDINYEIQYSNPLIGTQKNIIKIYEDNLSDIFNSRTFCLFEDIEAIKERGLAKGGNLDNAIVVNDKEILNKEGLRNKKEFVNHKILDCMGDLYTCGYRLLGHVKCVQGGHYLTNQLLRKVFKNHANYTVLEIKEKSLPHTFIQKSLLKSIA